MKVLYLENKGFTSEAIGLKLEITKSSVQTRCHNMLRKTGLNNTQQLMNLGAIGYGYGSNKKLMQPKMYLFVGIALYLANVFF